MKRSGNLQRTFVIVAMLLLVLAIPSAFFSYIYISGKRNYLTERNLRVLAAQSNQLKLRVENYGNNVLPNLVTKAAKDCGSKSACPLNVPPEQKRPAPLDSAAAKPFSDSLRTAFTSASNLQLVGDPTLTPTPKAEESAVTIKLRPELEGGSFQLAFDYHGPVEGKGYSVTFSAVARMAELVGRFSKKLAAAAPGGELGGRLSKETFDDVLVVSQEQNDNRVIFQQVTSGPGLVKLGPVKDKNEKDVPFADVMFYPGVQQLDSAGIQYKLFVQPVRLSFKGLSDNVIWSLCGLVRADRFRSESFAISYTLLLLFLFLFILATTSWPLLKLWSLGPADPLGLTDVIFASIAVLIISSVLTFFLLDVYAYTRFEQRLDQQLKQFADDIAGRFDAELRQLLQMLDRVNQAGAPSQNEQVTTSVLRPKRDSDRPQWLEGDTPYFGIATQIPAQGEKSGKQTRKWTIDSVSTAMIDVSNRQYFRNIKEERGWTRTVDGSYFRFFLEPIFSLNTGETLAELSVPGPQARIQLSLAEPQAPEWATTVTAKLISLRNTVLPPGFGYAVIDENGRVMFHSNLRRTLVENFVEECDRDRDLRALLATRAQGWTNAPYLGRGHRLYVEPLADFPWALVVFRDKEIARTANLELLSASLILSIFYGLIFVLPVLLLCLRRPEWMWPGAGGMADYRRLLDINLIFILLSLAEIAFVRHHHVPWLAFILPPFALLLNCLKLKKKAHSFPGQRFAMFALVFILPILLVALSWNDVEAAESVSKRVGLIGVAVLLYVLFFYLFPPKGLPLERVFGRGTNLPATRQALSLAYLLVAVSLVVIISVLPTLVFFRSVHDGEMEIFVKHGQFYLAGALRERDQRVRDEYRDVDLPDGYLKRRLTNREDVYQDFFFGTSFDEVETNPGERKQVPATSRCVPERHLFDEAMGAIRPLYDDVAVQTRELVHDTTGDCTSRWKPDGGKIQLVTAAAQPGWSLHMESDVPFLSRPGTSWWWLGSVVAALIFLAAVYLLVRFVARRIFLLGQTFPPAATARVTDLGRITENTLVLGTPFAGKSKLLRRSDFLLVDIRLIDAAGWTEALKQEVPADKKIVAIDHLEYRMEDPECNSRKLQLLEKYLYANRTLVVASAADPMSFVMGTPSKRDVKAEAASSKDTKKARNREEALQEEEHEGLSSQYMSRWAAVWSTFNRRVEAATAPDSAAAREKLQAVIAQSGMASEARDELFRECSPTEPLRRIAMEITSLHPHIASSKEQIVAEVLGRARAYYRALWATCSAEEKFALFDLAQDGFVNAKSQVLRQLVGRGLIVSEPHLRLLNESFRQFVLEMELTREIAALPTRASPWAVVRGTLIAALIVAALVVFLTQPQLLNTSTAFIGTASAGIPALLKLFDMIRGHAPR